MDRCFDLLGLISRPVATSSAQHVGIHGTGACMLELSRIKGLYDVVLNKSRLIRACKSDLLIKPDRGRICFFSLDYTEHLWLSCCSEWQQPACSHDMNGGKNYRSSVRAHFTDVLPLTLCHSQRCLLDCWSNFFTWTNFYNFHPICELYRQKMKPGFWTIWIWRNQRDRRHLLDFKAIRDQLKTDFLISAISQVDPSY